MLGTNTTDINNTENTDIFQDILNTLLKNKLSQYSEDTLFNFMNYLATHIDYRKLSKPDLEKLTTIYAEFLSFYCAENLHLNNNQTTPPSYSQFLTFSKVLKNKDQSFLQKSCETTLDNTHSSSFNLATQLGTAAAHGTLSGTIHACTTLAIASAKKQDYTETQLKLIKAGSVVFNSLTIVSYAAIATYIENTDESEATPLEKMAQSFALSLVSTTSLYALTHGIHYFAKAIENKLIKGFLNTLPLAGNVGLSLQNGNKLTETVAKVGTHIASAAITTTILQSGWHFFSKRRNIAQNTDLTLELGSNRIENTSPSFAETSFFISENRNNANSPHYEVIGNTRVEEGGYMCMKREPQRDSNGYLHPNPPIPVTGSNSPQPTFRLDTNDYSLPKLPAIPVTNLTVHNQSSTFPSDNSGYSHPKPPIPITHLTTQTPNPPLPLRNQQFFSTGGLNVSGNNKDNAAQSPANNFNNVSHTN